MWTNGLSGTRAEAAYQQIRDQILRCELRPGMILTEARVVADFGTTRALARTALGQLASEGFVHPMPRVGYIVDSPTLLDIDEIFSFREVLERALVDRAAARISAEEAQALRSINAVFSPDDPVSHRQALDASKRFHLEVARIAGNRRMEAMLASLLDELTRVLHMGLMLDLDPNSIQSQQAVLVDALVKHDGALASALVTEEIARARRQVQSALERAFLAGGAIPVPQLVGPADSAGPTLGRETPRVSRPPGSPGR